MERSSFHSPGGSAARELGFTLAEAGKGLGEARSALPALGVTHTERTWRQEQCWRVQKPGGRRAAADPEASAAGLGPLPGRGP